MKNIYILGILGVIVFVVVSFFIGSYNRYVTMTQDMDGQWSQVETQYQRRYDLIPNLVNSVKGVLEQEQEVFGAIAEARTRYGNAGTADQKAAAATQLESALSRLLVVIENYPQLKSNETVNRLMDELAGTENRIAVERSRYNDLVKVYNTEISKFPGVMISRIMGFEKRNYFESTAGADIAPKVDLNVNENQ